MGGGRGTNGASFCALMSQKMSLESRVQQTFGSSVVLTYGLGRMILYFGGTGVGPLDFRSADCWSPGGVLEFPPISEVAAILVNSVFLPEAQGMLNKQVDLKQDRVI